MEINEKLKCKNDLNVRYFQDVKGVSILLFFN